MVVSLMTSPVCCPAKPLPAFTMPLMRLRVIRTLFAWTSTSPSNRHASYVPVTVIVVGHEWSVVPDGTPVLLALGKSDDGGGPGRGGGGEFGGAGEGGLGGEPPDDGDFGDALPLRRFVYAMARVRRVMRLCFETCSKSTA